MKPSGKLVLLAIAAVAVVVGVAVFLHLPASQPLLAHLHGAAPGGMHAGMPGNRAPERDASAASAASSTTAAAMAGVAAIGSRWDAAAFAETVALYTAAHRELDWPGLLPPETFAYGADPQQNLDLFRPEQPFSEPGPVFLFIHGNGLGADDWRIPNSEGLLLAHAGRVAATAGGLGVLMNYRTGEAASAATGAEDLGLVIDWIRTQIEPYGGDPDTIVVVGHSEGALLTATYLFDAQVHVAPGSGIAAAVLSSGLLGKGAPELGAPELGASEPGASEPGAPALAAPDLAELIAAYEGDPVPLALWRAELDTAEIRDNMQTLYDLLCARFDDCPWFEQFEGYNHMSPIFSFGTDDSTVMNSFIRFYHTVR